MTAGQKTAFSLLISVLVFAGCAVAAFTGGFKLVEARFYQPRVVANINKQLNDISGSMDEYFGATVSRFASYTADKSVQTFIEPVPVDDDVRSRTTLTGNLFAETNGLLGIRLIDSNGRFLHYSTYSKDVLKKTDKSISYTNYDALGDIPYASIASADSDTKPDTAEKLAALCTVYMDSSKERIIFAFPYYDKYSVFRGTLVFYMDSTDFTRFLVSRNAITLSDRGTLVAPSFVTAKDVAEANAAGAGAQGAGAQETNADEANAVLDATAADQSIFAKNTPTAENSGIVFGLPSVGTSVLEKAIVDKWNNGLYGTEHLVTTENGDWILLTSIKSAYGKIGWVYNESIFTFPQSVKILLLVCIFITLFLIVFMLFNLKHDDMVIIKDRIRRFQLALVTEYIDRKDTTDWQQISEDIALRRQDVSDEIKKSLGHTGKRHAKEVDALLNRSWNEIISTLGGTQLPSLGSAQGASLRAENEQNTAQIKAMLEDILSKGTLTVNTIEAPSAKKNSASIKTAAVKPSSAVAPQTVKTEGNLEPVENLESVEDLESLEEVPEAEPVEEVEELEEIPEAEAVEDVEELEEVPEAEPVEKKKHATAEQVEEVEELEEVPEAEPVEEVEELEEVPEAEPVEKKEHAAAEPVEEVEELEEVPEAEPVEEEKLTEVPEAEPVEEEKLTEAPEAEPVEEEELTEVPEAVEAEPVAEVEELELLEDIAETKQENETVLPEQQISSAEFQDVSPAEFSVTNGPSVVDETQFIEPMCIGEPHKNLTPDTANDVPFSVALPDFSSLDSVSERSEEKASDTQKKEGLGLLKTATPLATEKPSLETVDVSDFFVDELPHGPVKISVNEKGFEEDLQFGSPKQTAPVSSEKLESVKTEEKGEAKELKSESVAFAPVVPDYSKLDESQNTKKVQKPHRGLLAAARNEEKKMLGSVPEVEPLPPSESSMFSFAGFGKQYAKPVELVAEKEAIVEHDGVYIISNDVETTGIKQDASFRKLVESVLK